MAVVTLLKFLLGNREAILKIAQSPRAVRVGFLFVLSAGLAREYDHENLLHEPWHALIPLGASLVTSAVLFLILYAMPKRAEAQRPPIATAYNSFLSLYWMTAPLAWFYAIPYERLLDAADSTAANLWTLAVVAAWRVALMTRVISVLLNIRIVFGFMIVMAFADALALTALSIADLPLINVMGGVALTQSEELLADVAFAVITLGLLSSGIWGLGALAAFFMARPDWSSILSNPLPESAQHHLGLMRLAIASVIFGLLMLPLTQPEQVHRFQVERHLRRGELVEGLALMSRAKRDDFPPHWDPPPRPGYGEHKPNLINVARVMASHPTADWVHALYVEKLDNRLRARLDIYRTRGDWTDIAAQIRTKDDTDLLQENREALQLLLQLSLKLSSQERQALESLLQIAPNEAESPAAADDSIER